jgi:hypothetical protein
LFLAGLAVAAAPTARQDAPIRLNRHLVVSVSQQRYKSIEILRIAVNALDNLNE